jgi:hypothetical protein
MVAKQQTLDTHALIYIDQQTRHMMEMHSVPRDELKLLFSMPLYREPANKWALIAANRLRHNNGALAVDFATHTSTLLELGFLQSAHQYLSAEMVSLDYLITTLFAELRPDLVIATGTGCIERYL